MKGRCANNVSIFNNLAILLPLLKSFRIEKKKNHLLLADGKCHVIGHDVVHSVVADLSISAYSCTSINCIDSGRFGKGKKRQGSLQKAEEIRANR